MKILCIGDPHFKTSNSKDTEKMTETIIGIAKSCNPDLIVNLGDTLDRHETIHVNPLGRAINFIFLLSEIAPTYVLIGNHDRPNNSVFLTDSHPFMGIRHKRVVIVDKVITEVIDGTKITFVPYVPPGRYFEALGTADTQGTELYLSHQEFKGAKMGALVSEEGDIWPLDYPMNISGHIHDYDLLQPNLLYVGTPIQHSFGDKAGKFLVIYDTASKSFEKIRLNICNKVTLSVTPTEALKLKAKINDLLMDNSEVRVVIKGSSTDISNILKREEIKEISKLVKLKYDDIGEVKEEEIVLEDKRDFLCKLFSSIEHDPGIVEVYSEIFGKREQLP